MLLTPIGCLHLNLKQNVFGFPAPSRFEKKLTLWTLLANWHKMLLCNFSHAISKLHQKWIKQFDSATIVWWRVCILLQTYNLSICEGRKNHVKPFLHNTFYHCTRKPIRILFIRWKKSTQNPYEMTDFTYHISGTTWHIISTFANFFWYLSEGKRKKIMENDDNIFDWSSTIIMILWYNDP